MPARPRCAHCLKAFTPNYRNRTKLRDQQRVCPDCGPVVGHRLAEKRYRDNNAPPRKRVGPSRTRPTQPSAAPTPVAEQSVQPQRRTALLKPGDELASQVNQHLSAIAALVGGPGWPDGCKPSMPLPIGIPEKSSRVAT